MYKPARFLFPLLIIQLWFCLITLATYFSKPNHLLTSFLQAAIKTAKTQGPFGLQAAEEEAERSLGAQRGRVDGALSFCRGLPVQSLVSLQRSYGWRATAPLAVAASSDLGITCPLLATELAQRRWERIRAHEVPGGHSEGMF